MGIMSEPKRRVLLASPRGYCAGVDRAVQSVELALERFGAPVYVRKQIVHNTHVVRTLEERGAIFVEETEEVPEGAVVVFSAHGIAPQVREDAAARGLHTIDATCPLVTKVHNEARRFAAQDYDILLIGHEGHEEVVGTTGEAPTRIHLVDGPEDSSRVQVRDPAKVAWLSQTTLSVDETNETVGALRERFPLLIDPPSDDICYATQNRQSAVKQIAAEADVVIVVGSRNSSNSVRLVEVATDAGAKAAYLVDDASVLDPAWLDGSTTVGVTSGASVPEDLVAGVLDWLAAAGFGDVEEVETVREGTVFALPHELRKAGPSRRRDPELIPAARAAGQYGSPRRSVRRSRTHRCSPRNRLSSSTMPSPASSQSAARPRVSAMPLTPASTPPPLDDTAATQIAETRNTTGGSVTTTSRSSRRVASAASTQAATKLAPLSTGKCSQPEVSVPGKMIENMASAAPRAVSRSVP